MGVVFVVSLHLGEMVEHCILFRYIFGVWELQYCWGYSIVMVRHNTFGAYEVGLRRGRRSGRLYPCIR